MKQSPSAKLPGVEGPEPSLSQLNQATLVRIAMAFALSLLMWANFDSANPGFQLVEKLDWLGGGISYHMGVDGISVLFVLLTAFLLPLCIVASWTSIKERVVEYLIAFLILFT